ncbi:hypothetical protein PTKIN_Ptkin13bG0000900 [Pterospermum kingtungense]
MASSYDNVLDQVSESCANMVIEDGDKGGVIIGDEDINCEKDDFVWCLVGRFMMEKKINFVSMQNTLASL